MSMFYHSKCEAMFNLEKNMKLHMASHNTDNLICPECGTKFRRLASFKSHLAIHQEEDNLSCPECEMEFSNEVGNLAVIYRNIWQAMW